VSGLVFAVIVVAFLVVGIVFVRRTQRRAFADRLPIEDDERVILEEHGLKLAHRFRRMSVRGGWTVTSRVRSVLTDRRIVLATGGPQGKHKFVLQMILDFTTEPAAVPEAGYSAYRRKFGLAKGYPTYYCSAGDVTVAEDALHVVVPFPESGQRWGAPPEVRLVTPNAARYEAAIVSAAKPSSPSP
jgi:hypothetical protein